MKLLITGINGFVANHFLDYLSTQNDEFTILGLGKSTDPFDIKKYPKLNLTYLSIDLLHKTEVGKIIKSFRPDYLLHLASISSVGHSWNHPQESFVNNTNIFLNLVEQIRIENINCKILSIGSSEEYGIVSKEDLPIKEDCRLNPVSPYAVARVSQEMISQIYQKGYGMNIVMTRSFNHIGPGQKDIFVISSFAKQLVKIHAKTTADNTVVVGDISVIRDFLDVRDVVKAYYKLLKEGKSGEIYNISSGIGISLNEILDKMCEILGITIIIKRSEKLIRPNDNPILIGNANKLKNELGWHPSYTINESLIDILNFWKISE